MAKRYAPARALENPMSGPRTEPVQDLIAEGPSGRTGENIGAWVGSPVELPPRKVPHERITGINIRIEH